MDPKSRVQPLDIPELLARVAYFVPLWEQDPFDYYYTTSRLLPGDVLSCLLVSKLWYKTFLPVLWQVYDFYDAKAPGDTLTRHSHLIRFFRTPSKHPGPFHCRSLTRLDIRGPWRGQRPEDVFSLAAQRELVRRNPRLKYLEWTGPSDEGKEPLEPQDFARLVDLEFLSLSKWDGSGGRFTDVLQTVAGSLKALAIASIHNVQASDLAGVSFPGVESLQIGWSRPEIPEPAEFVACFPNLVSLTINLGLEGQTEELAQSLRNNCPHLRTMVVLGGEVHTRDAEKLLGDCSVAAKGSATASRKGAKRGGGLTKIRCRKYGMRPLTIISIFIHAETLRDLTLENLGPDMLLSSISKVLARCRRLRRFSLDITNASAPSREVLKGLRRHVWRCHHLKHLSVSLEEWTDNVEDFTSISFGSFSDLGWYFHSGLPDSDGGDYELPKVNRDVLVELFGAVQHMGRLQVIIWQGCIFRRSTSFPTNLPRRDSIWTI
ncbi:hypothetical protein BGX29_011331 [Mortierella sp. GBA35]|nr:hypothetical protein BGX29_011331 [Mortierella sp. GBA35]